MPAPSHPMGRFPWNSHRNPIPMDKPENQSCPEIFHLIEYIFYHLGFLSNFRLPWKTKFALKIFTWIYFFIQDIRATLCLSWKTVCPDFTVLKYIFYHSRFLSNLRLPWKKQFALKFFTALNIRITFGIFELLCTCPEKQSLLWNLYCNIFIFQDFWVTCSCAEYRVCPEMFQCIAYTFHIQDFWGACACPEKQSVLWIHCIEDTFFNFQKFWGTCAYPEKQSLPCVHGIESLFFIIQNFEQIALALKTDFALIFQARGGGARSVSHWLRHAITRVRWLLLLSCSSCHSHWWKPIVSWLKRRYRFQKSFRTVAQRLS